MANAPVDRELLGVAQELLRLDPNGTRTAAVLRGTFDQLYDGLHTGRYRWDQLHKTEKTHFGTLVEINLCRQFKFEDGLAMDYRIAGVDVDCKYSQTVGGWMIPPETMGHLCMLVSADDQNALWSLGLLRIEEDVLSKGGNRDKKRTISAEGRKRIHWLFPGFPLPPNILLQLPRGTVDQIMALRSGQQRINQIFRDAQGMRISRAVIATLGQQDDYMKRVRGNGGSRTRLNREGIVILGEYDEHRRIAKGLGIAIPEGGEFVSVQLAQASKAGRGVVELDGSLWRVARKSDPVVAAPDCPHY